MKLAELERHINVLNPLTSKCHTQAPGLQSHPHGSQCLIADCAWHFAARKAISLAPVRESTLCSPSVSLLFKLSLLFFIFIDFFMECTVFERSGWHQIIKIILKARNVYKLYVRNHERHSYSQLTLSIYRKSFEYTVNTRVLVINISHSSCYRLTKRTHAITSVTTGAILQKKCESVCQIDQY